MKQNMGFILTFTAMMVTIALLHGCAAKGLAENATGKLTCVGYCELDINNSHHSISTTDSGGAVVEESTKQTGVRTNIETGEVE